MPEFLFCFGYQTEAQYRSRLDDEDSQCVLIEAPTEDDALSWGREVAENFVRQHYPRNPSWKSSDFAHWIEKDVSTVKWAEANATRCRVGEYPVWPRDQTW